MTSLERVDKSRVVQRYARSHPGQAAGRNASAHDHVAHPTGLHLHAALERSVVHRRPDLSTQRRLDQGPGMCLCPLLGGIAEPCNVCL